MEVLGIFVEILLRIAPRIGEMESRHWRRTLIALICWTVFIGVVGLAFWLFAYGFAVGTLEPTLEVVEYSVIGILVTLAVLALPAWLVIGAAYASYTSRPSLQLRD